jgi:hypothetical protein
LCPEHVYTLCNGEEEPKGHNNTVCPRAECQTVCTTSPAGVRPLTTTAASW